MGSESKAKKIGSYCYSLDNYTEEEYDEIVLKYIKYYHTRARNCKWAYYIGTTLKFIILACIPVVQATKLSRICPVVIIVLSSFVMLSESLLGMTRVHEKWILYRDMCNRLMSLQRKYHACRLTDRVDENRFSYIDAVEGLICEEARKWVERATEKQKENESVRKS